jgi:2-dehydro-3-deoxyphosphooctonate aldolase (KDO 8-P synthase)
MIELYKSLNSAQHFFLLAGPCVVEGESLMLHTAEYLKELCLRKGIPLVFKSSYRKANRTSAGSPMGPGAEEGLAILAKIKRELELPIVSDVHECAEIAAAAEVCDILQIPAFLSRQTELIQAAALSGRIVNIKKGQFMAPEDMEGAAGKALSTGNAQIMLTERGSSFGYHNLVVDFRGFAIMQALGYPVVYDVTHSLQRPSLGQTSGGTPEYAAMMARAAIATGKLQGLFIETHPKPKTALSDAASMLALDKIEALLDGCLRISEAIKETNNG